MSNAGCMYVLLFYSPASLMLMCTYRDHTEVLSENTQQRIRHQMFDPSSSRLLHRHGHRLGQNRLGPCVSISGHRPRLRDWLGERKLQTIS